jgi:hypothetical protein
MEELIGTARAGDIILGWRQGWPYKWPLSKALSYRYLSRFGPLLADTCSGRVDYCDGKPGPKTVGRAEPTIYRAVRGATWLASSFASPDLIDLFRS